MLSVNLEDNEFPLMAICLRNFAMGNSVDSDIIWPLGNGLLWKLLLEENVGVDKIIISKIQRYQRDKGTNSLRA